MSPPSATTPLLERLIALAKTLQFGWFVGHAVLIMATMRYFMSWVRMNWYSRMAQFSYRVTFLAAALTYGAVIYKSWRARQKMGAKQPGGPIGYIADENVQYMAMALVWLFMPQYPLAMLPYCIYSIFHVATYTRAHLIPTFFPPQVAAPAGASTGLPKLQPAHPLANAIGRFVKQYYDYSMSVVSALEILLLIRLLLAAILFQRRSWILTVLYGAFLRARYSQSSHVQDSFHRLEAQIDNLVGAQGTPPAARQGWETVKNAVRQVYAMTTLNKLTNAATSPKKTS